MKKIYIYISKLSVYLGLPFFNSLFKPIAIFLLFVCFYYYFVLCYLSIFLLSIQLYVCCQCDK